ncbi:hypothetical protein VDGD_06718 [Verticillium dahliae]|nr:hypothetical protein VDGD_06718 [Verticillium dahliae]
MKFQAIALSAFAGGAAAQLGMGRPPSPHDQAKATLVEDFKWRDPFTEATSSLFTPACEVTKTFPAQQYTLHQLYDKQPLGMWSWAEGLKEVFSEREYPGGFSGLDRHGWDRYILLMDYADVPLRAKQWIEAQASGKTADHGLFALFQKPKDKHQKVDDQVVVPEAGLDRADDASRVVLFAPGALYKILPLFVAESSNCADVLEDLSKYSPDAVDGGVVAWPISHSRPNLREKKRDIEIVIKAQVLKANEPAAKADADAEPEAKTVTKEEL